MTRQNTRTRSNAAPLPGDIRRADGTRSKASPWTRVDRPIEVTQADIDGALRENSNSCVIADAIKRQVPGAKKVSVDMATMRWTDTIKNRRIVCLTPIIAQQSLVRFDQGIKPQPFRFNAVSVQVAPLSSKITTDKDGKPTTRGAESTRPKEKRRTKTPVVKPRIEIDRAHGRGTGESVHKMGGTMPPVQRASLRRTFGARGFTWDEGELLTDIVDRQNAAAGRPAVLTHDPAIVGKRYTKTV